LSPLGKSLKKKKKNQSLYLLLELIHKKRPVAERAKNKQRYKKIRASQCVDLIFVVYGNRPSINILVDVFKTKHADTTNGVLQHYIITSNGQYWTTDTTNRPLIYH
jgi:hypothetical protein